MTEDDLHREQLLPAEMPLPSGSSPAMQTGKSSSVSIKFRQASQEGERGRTARRRALEQAHDELLRGQAEASNTPESVAAFVAAWPTLTEEAAVAALTKEEVLAALRVGDASPAVQRRAATEMEQLTAPKKPGRKPMAKAERAPALVLAARLARDLISALGAHGETERGYIAEYAAEWATYVEGRGVRPQAVHDTLRRSKDRNYAR